MGKTTELGSFVVVVHHLDDSEPDTPKPEPKIIIQPEGPLEGRDEMNLIELPFSLVSYRNSRKVKTIESRWVGKDEEGKTREFYKIVTGSDKWGLPTFQAEEVMIAALELTYRRGFSERRVHTTKYELLSLMRWPNTGHYCNLLTDIFNRLLGITISTNHFWDNNKRMYAEVGFHIIEDYRFFDDEHKRKREGKGQLALPLSYFAWNEVFWNSLESGYIKRLDTPTYFSLRSNLGRRLYRYADRHLHRGGIEIDLFRLAFDKLVMFGQYKYPAEVIRKLRPAIDELNGRGLAHIQIVESKTESGYKVVIEQAVKSPGRVKTEPDGIGPFEQEDVAEGKIDPCKEPSTVEGDSDHTAPGVNQELKALLIQRGISELIAEKLVEEYPDRIPLQVEIFDWIQEYRPSEIKKNPAGYLRRMIEEDWAPPEGFRTKTQIEQARQDAEEQRKRIEQRAREQRWQEWQAKTPEEKIQGELFHWERRFRKEQGRHPTPEERAQQQQELLAHLPALEAKMKSDLLGYE